MKTAAEKEEQLQTLLQLIRMESDLQSGNNGIKKYDRVRLNVSGTIFETYRKTLTQKEGSIFNLDSIRNYYDPLKEEYYFDRNPKAFEAIFTFMQSGILSLPPKLHYKIFAEELQYFGFGREALHILQGGHGKMTKNMSHADSFLATVWNLLEYPEINIWSKVWETFSMMVILLAVCLSSIDTLSEIHGTGAGVVNKNMEYMCVMWFTIEITLRFVSCPRKGRFLMNALNIIDIISLVPYYIEMLMNSRWYNVTSAMRTLPLTRLFTLLKLYRYSRHIRLVAKTLPSDVAEWWLMLFFLAVATMLGSPLLYYFQFNNHVDIDFQRGCQ